MAPRQDPGLSEEHVSASPDPDRDRARRDKCRSPTDQEKARGTTNLRPTRPRVRMGSDRVSTDRWEQETLPSPDAARVGERGAKVPTMVSIRDTVNREGFVPVRTGPDGRGAQSAHAAFIPLQGTGWRCRRGRRVVRAVHTRRHHPWPASSATHSGRPPCRDMRGLCAQMAWRLPYPAPTQDDVVLPPLDHSSS